MEHGRTYIKSSVWPVPLPDNNIEDLEIGLPESMSSQNGILIPYTGLNPEAHHV